MASSQDNTINITEGLIAAGIDPVTAEDIARRQSADALARLELRDQAIRDGTIGSEAYRDALRELRASETNLQSEVGSDAWDRYLYLTGQSNRIAVRSVMLGSAAERAGIQAGDMITSYDDSPLYQYRDLRAATIDGERDETVNLTVVRDGQPMTISLPRGPLGVRLSSLSLNPDAS